MEVALVTASTSSQEIRDWRRPFVLGWQGVVPSLPGLNNRLQGLAGIVCAGHDGHSVTFPDSRWWTELAGLVGTRQQSLVWEPGPAMPLDAEDTYSFAGTTRQGKLGRPRCAYAAIWWACVVCVWASGLTRFWLQCGGLTTLR